MAHSLEGKRVVVTGGTGSLGKVLVRRILGGQLGEPEKVIVFSRDEAKQHAMRLDFLRRTTATDDVIYRNFERLLDFRIGDIRDLHAVSSVLRDAHVVFNAAALKQVPTCEYFPFEAVQTNVTGPENIVRSILEFGLPVEAVISISTDKACKPVNVMGMTKALQERVIIRANLDCPRTRFVCVRYGNVLASRGSVVPLFHEQIRAGGPVTITTHQMTRFLLTLDQAVDAVLATYSSAAKGETYVPSVRSARIIEVARLLIGDHSIKVETTGIRPGEKVHEILVSEEEAGRTIARDGFYVILPILPELREPGHVPALDEEYSSAASTMTRDELAKLFHDERLLVEHEPRFG